MGIRALTLTDIVSFKEFLSEAVRSAALGRSFYVGSACPFIRGIGRGK